MSADYAGEKTQTAVRILASGSGSLADRVNDAWAYSLIRVSIHRVPWPDLQQRWEALRDKVDQLGAMTPMQLQSFDVDKLRAIA